MFAEVAENNRSLFETTVHGLGFRVMEKLEQVATPFLRVPYSMHPLIRF